MERAVNPKTGEVLFLVEDQWVKPTQTAINPKTGENAFLINNEWQTMPGMPKAGGTERTLGEALVTDPLAGLLSGTGTAVQSPGQLKQLVTGEEPAKEKPKGTLESLAQTLLPFGVDLSKIPEKVLEKLTPTMPSLEGITGAAVSPFQKLQPVGEELKAFGEKQKSTGLKAREKVRDIAIDQAEGFLPEAGAAIWGTLKDPALLSNFLFEQIPNFAGTLGGGAISKQMVKSFFTDATEKTLGKVGVAGAVATGGAMQAGDIGSDTYQTIYDRLVKEGTLPDEAHQIALEKGRMAAAQAGAISIASSFIPGGRALEKRFLTDAGKKAGFKGVIPGAGNIAGEIAQESTEEGGGKYVGNVQAAQVFPDINVMKGVGSAAGLGALGGGMFGGLSNLPSMATRTPEGAPTVPPPTVPPEAGGPTVPPGATPPAAVPLEAQLEETPAAVRLFELQKALQEVDKAFQAPDLTADDFSQLNTIAAQIRTQIAQVQSGQAAPAVTPVTPPPTTPPTPPAAPPVEAAPIAQEAVKAAEPPIETPIQAPVEVPIQTPAEAQVPVAQAPEVTPVTPAIAQAPIETVKEPIQAEEGVKPRPYPKNLIDFSAKGTLRISSPTEEDLAKKLSNYLGGTKISIAGEQVYNTQQMLPYYKVRKENGRYKLYELPEIKETAEKVEKPKEKTKAEINKARQAEKKAAATNITEEKLVDAIQSLAYKNGYAAPNTANDFITKYGKKMFDEAVASGLLDNEPGEGRLFPSNKYAYEVSHKYYDQKGKKIKAVKEEKPAEVKPKIEELVSPEVASAMKEIEFQKRLIKANNEKSLTAAQFSKVFNIQKSGKTAEADVQLTKILEQKEKKAKAKEELEEEHIEGKTSEPVTSKTIEESIDKAVSKVDYNKIKTAVKNQFDQAIKRAKIPTEKEWTAATIDANSYVTIDIPGDGKFKVKNNVERLKELQTKIANAVVPKVAKEPSGPSSGAIEAFKSMVDDKDMENAIEYAKLKGLDPKTVKLTPAQRTTVDKYLKNPAEFERQTEEAGQMDEARQTALQDDQRKRIEERLEADQKREELARFQAVFDTTIRSTEAQLKRDIAAKKISTKDAIRMVEVFPNYPDGTIKPYTLRTIGKLAGAEIDAKEAPEKLIGEEKAKAPTKKEKEESYKQKLKDLLQVNVGDSITFNQDIEYASKDIVYTITGSGEKSFGIYNPANDSRTTINYSTLLRQKSRGLAWEKSKEVEEKPSYTTKEREDAEHHAKDLGGEVAYQKGNIALIRGYSMLTGAPTYAVAKGTQRSKVEVGSYTGNLITAAEKTDLVKVIEQLEKDAQSKHKESPYINFKDGIALSEDIPIELGNVIKEWKKLLGLKSNIYVSTIQDAKANKGNFTGPHRVIGSGTLSTNEAGSMRRMPDDSYYVLFEKSTSKTKMLETIAHELGHVHEREVYINAPKEMKDAIQADFQKWLASQTGKTARELVDSLRAKTTAKTTDIAAGTKAENLSPYWKSFKEWYADQVSKWAVTSDKPLTIVEKFFKRLGNQMRQFYQNLKNKGYLPSESMTKYLNSMASSQDVIAGNNDDISSMPESMVKKIEAIPEEGKNQEEQSLIEDLNLPEVPEHEKSSMKDMAIAGYRQMQDWGKEFGDNPGKTATKNLISASDAITQQRIENVWFAAGLDKRDQSRYKGQIRTADGQMAASIAIKNAIHSAHIATQVIIQGALEYSQALGQFVAAKSPTSMANVVKLQYAIKKKLGKTVGLKIINAYFIGKRSRSIQNEFLNASSALQTATESNDFAAMADAQSDYNSVKTAYGKIPKYFRQLDANGKPMYETIYDDNGKAVDRIPILNDDAIDRAIDMEKLHPELTEMMKNWTAVNKNMLDMLAFSGRISKKTAEKLKSIKDYVPWYRIMDDQEDIHNGKLMSNYPGGPRRFKADETDRDINNVVENMIHNVVMMTRSTTKTYAINRVITEYGQRYEDGPKKGKLMVFPSEGRDAEGTRIASFIGGRRIVTNIPDSLVADSVLGLIAAPFTFPLQNLLGAASNGFRRSITLTPWFQVKQLIIDAPTAAWVSGVRNPFKLWAGCFSGFVNALEITGTDPVVQILRNAGVGGYQSFHRSARKEREIALGLLERSNYAKLLNFIDRVGDASDLSQRVSVYKNVLAESGDPALALLQASDIIDFQKHGKGRLAQVMRTTVTFMQAYATQLDALAQASIGGNLKGKARSKAAQQFLKTGLLLGSTTLLYAFIAGADDDYWELDDQTRLRNFYIPGSKKATGHHILIPMTTSAAFFFKAVPELVYSKVVSEGTKNEMDARRVWKALGTVAADALLGPTPVPTGAKPIAEIAFNHDFFTGGNVVPKGLEGLVSAEQYNSSTSNLGHWISSASGGALNPIQADHLIRGMGGSIATLGMYFSNLAFPEDRPAPELKQNPIIGNLVAPEVSRKNEELFYDLREKATGKYKTYQSMLENDKFDEADKFYDKNQELIDAYEYVSSMDTDLKEINKEVRRLGKSVDKTLTPKGRTTEINELKRLKSEILDSVTEFRKEAGF
jgi:hypothetical protein